MFAFFVILLIVAFIGAMTSALNKKPWPALIFTGILAISVIVLNLQMQSGQADQPVASSATDAPTDGPAHPNPTPAMNTTQQRAKIASLLEHGMSLLADATAVVNVTPPTRAAAAKLTGGPGGRFYDEDRAWRADLDALNSPGHIDDHAASVALLTILAGDQAMFVAVQDALASCNEHDARLKLSEAREDYRESKLVLGGENPDSFNGLDVSSKLTNVSQCE